MNVCAYPHASLGEHLALDCAFDQTLALKTLGTLPSHDAAAHLFCRLRHMAHEGGSLTSFIFFPLKISWSQHVETPHIWDFHHRSS